MPYLSNNHENHAQPPPGVLEVRVAFTRFFIVLCIGLEQTMLLDNKRHANK